MSLRENLTLGPQSIQVAVEVAPLEPLQEDCLTRLTGADDLRLIDPAKITAGQVPVAQPHLDPVVVRGLFTICRGQFTTANLAQELHTRLQLDLSQMSWPESRETVPRKQDHESDDQHQVESQCSPAEPREALPDQALGAYAHSSEYFRRSRWRTTSATVLTRKVRMNRTSPDRNNTR